jgi:cell wall-associated NlpC family hydrolase
MSPTPKQLCSRPDAVARARAWLGTPYVLGGRVRGAGCDCATLLAEYLIEIGAAEREDLGVYSHDWFCHTKSERYLLGLVRHARQTAELVCRGTVDARPGTLALFRCVGSHVYNHAAIITAWPRGIHAVHPKVAEFDLTSHRLTGHHEMALFDPWAAEEQVRSGVIQI